jgi:hypothetical protein
LESWALFLPCIPQSLFLNTTLANAELPQSIKVFLQTTFLNFARYIKMKRFVFEVLAVVAFVSALSACSPEPRRPTAQETEERKQEELSRQAINTVGLPAITNFAEKRMMKDILELRDKMTPTVTYLVGMNNQLTKLCDSIGYGLPYATQYTNPQKESDHSRSIIAQQDPNGLYSPASAEGTWILCIDPKAKSTRPVYVEPRVIVSPFPLQ